MSIGPAPSTVTASPPPAHRPVIIIGGGQAGLAMSFCLREKGTDHLILERHRLGEAWRSERWDSFCLVTPNWQCNLPGLPYQGNDPDGFMARRYRGRDVVAWLHDMGYYEKPIHEHPRKERVRAKANHYVTGRDGGRDIDLRRFALEGMQLYGRLRGVSGSTLTFADDLKQNLDHADQVSESIKTTIDQYIAGAGIDAPEEARYQPVWEPPNPEIDALDWEAAGIRNVIWSMGFRTNYTWLEVPVFDGKGYPAHDRGVTPVPGLYFLGLPWQYTWGSGRFSGVAADARHLMGHLTARSMAPPATDTPDRILNEWALGS